MKSILILIISFGAASAHGVNFEWLYNSLDVKPILRQGRFEKTVGLLQCYERYLGFGRFAYHCKFEGDSN